MANMQRPIHQMSVATMLGLVACIAVNIWLFRVGVFWGIVGLNITKHVMIAYLCGALGVDRRQPTRPTAALAATVSQLPTS
jgi:predicted cobalt transporter CbtA